MPRRIASKRGADVHRLAAQEHATGIDGHRAEDRLENFGAARTDESGEADDLALPDVERRVEQARTARDTGDGEQRRHLRVRRAPAREHCSGRPAGHELDELRDGCLRGVPGPDVVSVAQDGDPIRQPQCLFQEMGDEDDAHALFPDEAQPAEQLVTFVGGQRRGGLVEKNDPGGMNQRPGDLDELALRLAQALDGDARIDVCRKQREVRFRLLRHRAPVEKARAERRVVDQDVLGHAQGRQQRELLVDHDDAGLERRLWRERGHDRALELQPAFVRLEMPAHDLDERALPGAVLAQNGVDLSGHDLAGDVVERLRRTETLGNLAGDEPAIRIHAVVGRLERTTGTACSAAPVSGWSIAVSRSRRWPAPRRPRDPAWLRRRCPRRSAPWPGGPRRRSA